MNKVAILGSGKSAENFIKALKLNSDFKLIQIGSRNKNRAKKISTKYSNNIEINSINKVIESEKNNLVIVCLPASIQFEVIKKLFKLNKNVICEKPFVINYIDSTKLLKIWKKFKPICLINYCYNFLEPLEFFSNEIQKNKINIHTVNISWKVSNNSKIVRPNWKNKRNMGGGVLYNFSSHLLNLLFPKKTKLKILSSEQYYLKNKRIKRIETNDNKADKICSFTLKNKFIYNFFLSTISNPTLGIKMELIGTKGTRVMSNFNSDSPTNGFIMKSYFKAGNKIKITDIKFNKKKIYLHDLYLKTLNYYNKVKKKRLRNYKNSINHGVWNTYLLDRLQNYKSKK